MAETKNHFSFSDTELHYNFERGEGYVELRNKITEQTIVEWRNEQLEEAIQDGFLSSIKGGIGFRLTDWDEVQKQAFDYAQERGMLDKPADWLDLEKVFQVAEKATPDQNFFVNVNNDSDGHFNAFLPMSEAQDGILALQNEDYVIHVRLSAPLEKIGDNEFTGKDENGEEFNIALYAYKPLKLILG